MATLLALAALSQAALADQWVNSGSYTGNGDGNRDIWVGFQPNFVIVKSEDSNHSPIMRIESMPSNFSKSIGESGPLELNQIRSFSDVAFQVGSHESVNDSGSDNYWVAVKTDGATSFYGSYTGSGIDRSITGLPFTPDYVAVFPAENRRATFRTSAMPSGTSYQFQGNDPEFDGIQDFFAGGFDLGSANRVNKSGELYYYLAIAGMPEELEVDQYIGTGNNTWINTTFDPELVFVRSADSEDTAYRAHKGWGNISFLCEKTSAPVSGRIRQLDDSRFRIGDSQEVNNDGDPYFYLSYGHNPPPGADIAVRISADPESVLENETTVITVLVSSFGPDPADVGIEFFVPSGLTYESHVASKGSYNETLGAWGLSSIAEGDVETLEVTVRAVHDAGGTITTASAQVGASSLPDANTPNNDDSVDITIVEVPPSADLWVEKSASVTQIDEGGTFQYTIEVENLGPDSVGGVVISDPFPTGLSLDNVNAERGSYDETNWTVGGVGLGERLTLTLDVTPEPGTAGTIISNVASVGASELPDLTASNDSDDVDVRILGADLTVTQTVDPTPAGPGDAVVFEVFLENAGPDPANNVELTISRDAGINFTAADPDIGTFTDSVWTIASLGSGTTVSMTLDYEVDLAMTNGLIDHTAEVTSVDTADPNAGDEQDTTTLTVDRNNLSVTKVVDRSNPNEGETVQYEIAVLNDSYPSLPVFVIEDLLPSGVTYLGHTILRPAAGGRASSYDPDTGVWSMEDMRSEESAQLQIDVEIDAGTAGQTIVNTATIVEPSSVDGNPADDEDSASLTVRSTDLQTTVAFDRAILSEGENVDFDVTVFNLGPDDATGVNAGVTLPTGLVIDSVNIPQGTFDSGAGTWDLGSLAVDTGVTATLTVTAIAGTAGQDLGASATATSGTPPDTNAANDTDNAEVHVLGADLAVSKTASDPIVPPGEFVEFEIRVSNLGPDPASDIRVDDILPTGLTYTSHSATAGDYNLLNGRWTFPTLPFGQTETLTLTALVNSTETVANTATIVSSTPTDPVSANNSDTEEVGSVSADLAVSVGASSTLIYEGNSGSFTVTVVNQGPSDATGVRVEEFFPESLDLVGASASRGSYDAGSAVWNLGDLDVGQSGTLTLEFEAPLGSAGPWEHAASLLSFDQVDPAPDNNSDSMSGNVVAEVDISIDLAAAPLVLKEGQETTLSILATNLGPSPSTGVVLSVSWGDDLEWVSHDTGQGSFDPVVGTWIADGIARDADASLSVTLAAKTGSAGATALASASLSSVDQTETNSTNDSDQVTVEVAEAISVSATQAPVTLWPGGDVVELIRIDLANPSIFDEVLNSIEFDVTTTGPGTDAELHGNWQDIELRHGSEVIGSTALDGPTVSFSGLALSLEAGNSLPLSVWSGASLGARDSDRLDLSIPDEGRLSFASPVPLEAAWPLDPAGDYPIDGLVAAQIIKRSPSANTLEAGGDSVLVFDFDVPGNGYESHQLQSISLSPSGSLTPAEVGSFEIWRGAGPGAPGGDILLGTPSFADDRWTLDGLDEVVEPGGLRIYGMLGVTAEAVEGRELSWSLDAAGAALQFDSDNDGPIDTPVELPGTFAVVQDDTPTVTAQAVDLTLEPLLPGGEERSLLRFTLSYPGPDTLVLNEIEVTAIADGVGTPSQLDESWARLNLFVSEPGLIVPAEPAGSAQPYGPNSGRGAALDHELGNSVIVEGGQARFVDLGLPIYPGVGLDVSILAAASITARDGDHLQLLLADGGALVFGTPPALTGNWPLISATPTPVDGMSSAQIPVSPLDGALVPAGTNGVAVFGFTVPPNGYEADVLESVSLVNLGDAVDTDMILELFVGTESLGFGTFGPDGWVWPSLELPVPPQGLLLRVQADVSEEATAGRSIHLALPFEPDGGLQMASGNDGPIDASVSQAEPFEIVPPNGSITAFAQSDLVIELVPGAAPSELLHLIWTNGDSEAHQLQSMVFSVHSFGAEETSVLESHWTPFELRQDSADGEDESVGSGTVVDGRLEFDGLDIDLEPGAQIGFTVHAGAGLGARDGDLLDIGLELASTGWTGSPEVTALNSMNPAGFAEVNGMAAAQIVVHPLSNVSVEAGSNRNLSLDFTVPGNGYEADVLKRVDIGVSGSATVSDINVLELWVDDGDGVFSAANDTRLGPLEFTGGRWEITGLSLPVPVGGQRLFTTTDIAEAALESRSFELYLPSGSDVGLGMSSGNDGPIDEPVRAGAEQVISSVDRVALAAREIGPLTVWPGQSAVPLLYLFATNTHAESKQIDELTFDNVSIGLGSAEQMDEAFEVVALFADANGNGTWDLEVDDLVGTGSFSDGSVRFRNLSWELPPDETSHLFLVGEISTDRARDGDVLAVQMSDPVGVVFREPAALTGDWPLSSGARLTVDGMVSAQIDRGSVSTRTYGPGQGPVLAMELGLPSNGYRSDSLQGLTVRNEGEAGSEVGSLSLWSDGGNGVFDAAAADDIHLGDFARVAEEWIIGGLAAPLPEGGERFFISLQVSGDLTESTDLRLSVPVGGIDVQSENDGPVDTALVTAQTVVLSSAPLLTSVDTAPSVTNVDQIFDVEVRVTNRSEERIEDIVVPELTASGNDAFTVLSGPSPERLTLDPAEEGTMTWQVQGIQAGTVEIKARPQGRSSQDGTSRGSLEATSNPHEIRIAAQGLDLFALGSFPVTLSYGQTGVVPLSFTFRNPGEVGGSDVRLNSIRVRLVDEVGEGVNPSDLFERIVVNEGNRIYLSTTDFGTEPTFDLILTSPIEVTTTEPTTVSLRVDIAEISQETSYRMIIESAESFDATDGTNGVPVGVQLVEGDFPIVSGLARLVSEATFVEINPTEDEFQRAAPGTQSIAALRFDLTSQGGAEARIGSFALSGLDENGTPVPDLSQWLRQVRIKTPLQTLAEAHVVAGLSGDSLSVRLTNALSVPSGSVVPVTVEVDLQEDSTPGVLHLVLEEPESFDARDSNTGGSVPVVYLGENAPRGSIRVEAVADELHAGGMARFPEQLTIGSREAEAFRLTLEHPGGDDVGRISVLSLETQFWNQNRDGVAPGDVISALWAKRDEEIVGQLSPVPRSGRSAVLRLSDILLEAGESVDLSVFVDIEAGAPAGWLELTLGSDDIEAVDVNSAAPTQVTPRNEAELPVFSGLTRLTAPARELFVEIENAMPAALVRDGNEITIGEIVFSHPSDEGAGPIQIEHLDLRMADAAGERSLASEVRRVSFYREDKIWDHFKVRNDDIARLEGEPFFVSEGEEVRLEMRVSFEPGGQASQVRFGMEARDVGIVQPEGAAFLIEARGKTGNAFPLWTASGNFSDADLESSYGNFPNPFAAGREETNFVYYLPEPAQVSLRVWTLRGAEVITLLEDHTAPAGLHQEVYWDGRNGEGNVVVNGVYLAELKVDMEGGSERILRKVAVVR